MWKGIENCVRKWSMFLCIILFWATSLGRFERCGSSLVTCQIYCFIRFTSQRLPNFWSSRCLTTSRPWRSRFKSALRPRRSATKKSTRMKGKLKSSDKNFKRDASAWAFHFHLIQTIKVNFATTLESLIIVPLVIRVPQSNGRVQIVFYGFLSEIRLLRMVSLLRCSIQVWYSTLNSWIIYWQ